MANVTHTKKFRAGFITCGHATSNYTRFGRISLKRLSVILQSMSVECYQLVTRNIQNAENEIELKNHITEFHLYYLIK